MQYFRDPETGAVFAFEDDVRCEYANGVWQFFPPGSDEPLPGPYPVTLEATDDPTPPPYVPTPEDNVRTRVLLIDAATRQIAPLQDMVEFDMASDADIALLKAWKLYRIALTKLDVSVSPVAWPTAPDAAAPTA
jgi:hypothetical protein